MRRTIRYSAYAIPGIQRYVKSKGGRVAILHPDVVIGTILEVLNIGRNTIFSKSRRREIREPRQMVMYFLCRYTDLSLPAIGEMCNRSHATVISAEKRIKTLIEVDHEIDLQVKKIESELLRIIK